MFVLYISCLFLPSVVFTTVALNFFIKKKNFIIKKDLEIGI